MKDWLRGTRGMVLMVVTWIVGWGLGFGGLAELLVDPHGETLDMWPAEMAIPGFISGVLFVILFRIVEGRHHFDEVPYARISILGVATGLAIGALSSATGGPIPLDLTTAEMIGLAVALCVVAAIGSVIFFRLLAQGWGSLSTSKMG